MLREEKFKRQYRERMKKGTPRRTFSFACLVPKESRAVADATVWEDSVELVEGEISDEDENQDLLSNEEEDMVRRFYQEKVQESCTQLFRTSDKVKCCAVMLFKRFYLSNSVMQYHPKFIVPTAIYVAGKTEEQYIQVDTIADLLKLDHKDIIAHELILLQGVRFQVIMYHPFRSLLGFVDDARLYFKTVNRALQVDTLQSLHAQSVATINEMLLTDIPLKYSASFVALAALRLNQADGFDVEQYVRQGKTDGDIDEVLDVLGRIEGDLKQAQGTAIDPKHIKKLYKKLKDFYPQSSDEPKKKKRKKTKKSVEAIAE